MPSQTTTWSAHCHWSPDARHVGDARRFAADRMEAGGLDDLMDPVCLIVSELVTNAVRHTRSSFRLTLVRDEATLLIAVHDDSPDLAVRRHPGTSDTNGRGLELVSLLSKEWGVTNDPHGGKSVWARLSIEDGHAVSG